MVLGYKIDQKWHFERSLVKPIRPLGRNIARREREKTAKTDFFFFWSIRWQDRLGAKTRNRSSRRPPLNLHAKVTSLFILTPRERIYRRYHQNKQKINQNGYENEHTVEYTSSYSYCICYYWTYWSFRNANLTLFCPVLIVVPISVPDQALGSIPGRKSVPNWIKLNSCKGNLYVILWSMLGSNKSLTKHLLGNISVSHLLYLLTGKHFKIKYFVITYKL